MHFRTVLPKLKALLPYRTYQQLADGPNLSADYQDFSQAYLRLLYVSLSSGFAGLGGFPVADILAYLQTRLTDQTISTFINSLGRAAWKGFAESLLDCGMRAGRADVVDSLLSRDIFGLDVNRNIILEGMERLTLAEFAAAHQDIAMIRVLLERGADVAQTLEGTGVLLRLVNARRNSLDGTDDWYFLDLGRLLLQKGAKVHEEVLDVLLGQKITGAVSDLTELVIQYGAPDLYRIWTMSETILSLVLQLHPAATIRIFQILINAGADFKVDVFVWEPDAESPITILEAAAKTGNLELMQMLRSKGARHTAQTFEKSLESGNHGVIRFLIHEGAIPIGSYSISFSMSRAIYDGGPELIQLLKGYPRIAEIFKREILCATIYATSQAGDIAQLESLLESPILEQMRLNRRMAQDHSEILGRALAKASSTAQAKVSFALLNAGAEPSACDPNGIPAIINALKAKEKKLVHALIKAGAELDCYYNDNCLKTPLMYAVEWSDRDLVENLIHAGAPVNKTGSEKLPDTEYTALSIAVASKDAGMATILLEAGAITSLRPHRDSRPPLAIAVETNDPAMVRLLLASGADLDHPSILLAALDRGADFFRFLIRENDRLRPYDRKKWGGCRGTEDHSKARH